MTNQANALDDATRKLSHDIFKQLIEINTTDSVGSTTVAAEAMAKRLLDAGFPAADVQVLGPNERKGNMVARLRGTGAQKPILIIGHLDVVEARREDWTTDPFQFVEKDGYFYGRGTQDMKGSDAMLVTTFIRFKKEGYLPDRDIILALTADEEGGKSNGVDWLLKNHRDLIDAEFVLNPDSGGVTTDNGKPVTWKWRRPKNSTPIFSSRSPTPAATARCRFPTTPSTIWPTRLARLEHYHFPFELNAVTRAYFERRAATRDGADAADMQAILETPPGRQAPSRGCPRIRATTRCMRTTCVATRLNAGHANNALPQTAQANVNCRILPGHARKRCGRI